MSKYHEEVAGHKVVAYGRANHIHGRENRGKPFCNAIRTAYLDSKAIPALEKEGIAFHDCQNGYVAVDSIEVVIPMPQSIREAG